MFGFPAEIIIKIAPIIIAMTAKGVAIIKTMKLYMLTSILKKSFIPHAGSPAFPQGTKPSAFAKMGTAINNSKIQTEKKIFFIVLAWVPSPGFEPGTLGSKPSMISSFTTRA